MPGRTPQPAFPIHMRSLSDTERQEFLAATHVAVLSVAAADGRPPASVPIWYDYAPGDDIGSTPPPRAAKPGSSNERAR
jgi:hypothetical protein